ATTTIRSALNALAHHTTNSPPARAANAITHPASPNPPPIALQNLRKVWHARIPVVMGTDAGNIGTLHGPSVFREMEIMTQAGLSPLQVLRSSTSNGANAMVMERDIGTLAGGKLSGMVILD